jgi:hypothetical protein
MIDNKHVVVLRGSGRDMVPVPEMAALERDSAFSSWRTRLAMRTVRRAWRDRSALSRGTSWLGAPSVERLHLKPLAGVDPEGVQVPMPKRRCVRPERPREWIRR